MPDSERVGTSLGLGVCFGHKTETVLEDAMYVQAHHSLQVAFLLVLFAALQSFRNLDDSFTRVFACQEVD